MTNLEIALPIHGELLTPEARASFPAIAANAEYAAVWESWMQQGSLADKLVMLLNTSHPGEVPVRWLANIASTAQMFEHLRAHGVEPPRRIQLFTPIHINTAANILDPLERKEKLTVGRRNADELFDVAQAYMTTFHPDLAVEVEHLVDGEVFVEFFQQCGDILAPLLPDNVKAELMQMGGKRLQDVDEDVMLRRSATYLMDHVLRYGFLPLPGHEMNQTLYLMPQSEQRFVGMMPKIKRAVEQVTGMPFSSITEQQNVVLFHPMLRTPHYQPHENRNHIMGPQIEPLICSMRTVGDWPRDKHLQQLRLNGSAQDEIRRCFQFIQADIAGIIHNPQMKPDKKVWEAMPVLTKYVIAANMRDRNAKEEQV